MERKTEILKELKELSPFIAEMKEKEDGFKVPEHYFDYLSGSVLEQVKLQRDPSFFISREKSFKWLDFFRRYQVSLGFTVVILIALIVVPFYRDHNEENLADISAEDAALYIANNLDDFETSLFIQEGLLEDIADSDFSNININELNDYLEESIDEIDEILLEQFL